MDTPFSSTNYTNELIQNQQARSVADVLRNDPSVRQARGFGNFQELYVVRGFPVYSDDIAYNGLYGMLPRQYIASEFFERVEVFRGANTFLNGVAPGGSGIGGAINLLPKRALNEPLNRITAGAQSGGQGFVAADLARRFGPDQSTGFRLNAVRRDGGTGIDREKQELSALSLGFDWRSRNARISADVGYQDHELRAGRPNVTPSSTLPIPEAPDAKTNFAQSWTRSAERDLFATVRAEVDLADNVTAWTAAGVRRSSESNSLSNPSLVDGFGNSLASRFDNERKDRIATGEVGLRGSFATGPVKHTVSTSASIYSGEERNTYAFSGSTIRTNIYAPFDSLPPPATALIGGNLANPLRVADTRTKSFAVADTLSLAQDTVKITLGVRRQNIEKVGYDYNSGAELSRYEEAKTTPVAAVVWKATPQLSAYASYIEALSPGETAPTLANSLPVTNAGQVFAPYASKQKEIGLKYDGGKLGGSIAYFTTDKPVYIVQNQTFGTYGEQRNQGIELSVFGEPTQGVRLLGGVTFLDAEQRRTAGGRTDGLDAIGVPKTQLNLGAEWDVPGVRGLTLDARVLHTSKQYANVANTQQLPSWNRLDVGARYLVDIGNNRLLTLRGRIDNLFNKSYWASTGGFPGSNYLVLGAPRTFVVSASVDF
ncbi:TonB-dependent receptor [Burkholderiales bacterium 8X]|nr:TonB-dependent receptor [Burkholderiales bacterium 8X]